MEGPSRPTITVHICSQLPAFARISGPLGVALAQHTQNPHSNAASCCWICKTAAEEQLEGNSRKPVITAAGAFESLLIFL